MSTAPCEAPRPARFSAEAMPFSRSHFLAASRSPSFSSRAFLQSIIPAPVSFRSAATSLAEISGILVLGGGGLGGRVGRGSGLFGGLFGSLFGGGLGGGFGGELFDDRVGLGLGDRRRLGHDLSHRLVRSRGGRL